jgi:hypothetical protein
MPPTASSWYPQTPMSVRQQPGWYEKLVPWEESVVPEHAESGNPG